MLAKEAGTSDKSWNLAPMTPTENRSTPEDKKVFIPQLFCGRVRVDNPDEKIHDFHIFIDRTGIAWRCPHPWHCDHAIIMNGCIHSCKVRTAELNEMEARS
jgi:hypothetical protein